MQKFIANQALLYFLFVLTIAAGYLGFRFLYSVSEKFPFSQEMILIFLGAIATILITAILLNRQTELELRKEGQVLLLDRKSSVYIELIDRVGDIVARGKFDDDNLAELRRLNHKLAMIASPDVIVNFSDVLENLSRAAGDAEIEHAEGNAIMVGIANLTYHMRRDLLGGQGDDEEARLHAAILANNTQLEA